MQVLNDQNWWLLFFQFCKCRPDILLSPSDHLTQQADRTDHASIHSLFIFYVMLTHLIKDVLDQRRFPRSWKATDNYAFQWTQTVFYVLVAVLQRWNYR